MSQIAVMTPEQLRDVVSDAVRSEVGAIIRELSSSKAILDEREAAEYLGRKPSTLSKWRMDSRGPKYNKQGSRVSYRKVDLDAWLAASCITTIEDPNAPRR